MKSIAVVLISVSLMFVVLPGCQQPITTTRPSADAPKFYDDIVWVTLSIERPFLDDDMDHIPDGALVRVMLNTPSEKAFVAGRGSLVIHLIKRIRTEKGTFTDQEMHTWNIKQEDFERALVRQRYGIVCHQMAIYWYGVAPQGPSWYLKADFIRTDQKKVSSRLISLVIPERDQKSPQG